MLNQEDAETRSRASMSVVNNLNSSSADQGAHRVSPERKFIGWVPRIRFPLVQIYYSLIL